MVIGAKVCLDLNYRVVTVFAPTSMPAFSNLSIKQYHQLCQTGRYLSDK
jgi:hypothetical protein